MSDAEDDSQISGEVSEEEDHDNPKAPSTPADTFRIGAVSVPSPDEYHQPLAITPTMPERQDSGLGSTSGSRHGLDAEDSIRSNRTTPSDLDRRPPSRLSSQSHAHGAEESRTAVGVTDSALLVGGRAPSRPGSVSGRSAAPLQGSPSTAERGGSSGLQRTSSQLSGQHTPRHGQGVGGSTGGREDGAADFGLMSETGQDRRSAQFTTPQRGGSQTMPEAPGSAPARLLTTRERDRLLFSAASPTQIDLYATAGATTQTARQESSMAQGFRGGLRHAGWLFKMVRRQHQIDASWKKYWFYLVDDRLYYSLNTSAPADTEAALDGRVRYITLDRIPVRPLPHRHKRMDAGTMSQPDVGVSLVPPRTLQSAGIRLAPGTVFALVAGSHTYFLAADTPEDAQTWVRVLRQHWLHCFKHPLRTAGATGVHHLSLMLAENVTLRKSVRDQAALARGVDSEYWSKWIEEKMRNRVLEDRFDSMVTYEVEIKTGRMKGAASDARVYIEMFSAHTEDSTGELLCANVDLPRRVMRRNALDLFEFKTRNVGMPGHIRVWHDNTGRHPDWFLEYVRIRKKTPNGRGLWATYPCQRWFSTQLDDCRISRVLFIGHATPLIVYQVKTVTSDLRGAGTDANVHFIMHGVLGDGERHILSGSADDFDRDTTNHFTIQDEELGDLLEVTIGHDGTGHGPSWHLDHLTVTNTKTKQTYLFPCRQWFDTRIGDGSIERTLAVGDALGEKVAYTIWVTTSDIRGAGTDADVHVVLHGELGDTPQAQLPSRPEHFERGQTDEFRLTLPGVGRLESLTIGHNNMGRGPSWHLEMVQVLDESTKDMYYFPCGKWLAVDHDDGQIERTLLAVMEDPSASSTTYRVEFHTSKERGAGTDANVFFQLHGGTASSPVYKLQAPKEAFERGSVDVFSYKMRYLGMLKRMIVQHDNTGDNPAWLLLKVVVHCAKDDTVTVFACNQWLQSPNRGVFPSVELLAGSVLPDMLQYKLVALTSDMRGAGTDGKVSVELFGTHGSVGPISLDKDGAFERGQADTFFFEGVDVGAFTKLLVTLVGHGSRVAWHLDHMALWRDAKDDTLDSATYFRCREWFNHDHGMVKELLPERHPGHETKAPYTIRVFTSDIKGAGTDAGVELNFVGDLGETGYVRLVANHDILERGQEDVFEEYLRDIGRPHYCLVRSDGKSRKPTWHLDTIILDTQGRMQPVFFWGNLWLGPSSTLTAKIPAAFFDPRVAKVDYHITVVTSDVKHAGTDMGVVIEIMGDLGASGRLPLIDVTKDTFERGRTDQFVVQSVPLGHLGLLRVTVDGKGTPWHLKMIIVQGKDGGKYYFPYNNWLGAQNPTTDIKAQLHDPDDDMRSYRLTTFTSALQGAGTDANVYVELRGGRGTSGKIVLRNTNIDNFEAGQADEFTLGPFSDLGPLSELVIGHDNAGSNPAWHLEAVKVTDLKTNMTFWFACDQWLSKAHGALERVLRASLSDPRRPKASYTVTIRTSDLPGAGTSSNVFVDIRGVLASTGLKMLNGSKSVKPFDRAATDEFVVDTVPLGNLRTLLIGHDGSGPDPRWHCEYVEVKDNASGQTWWFDCQQWFDPHSGDKLTERLLQASNQKPGPRRTECLIVVNTSNIAGAGTDANVYIVLHGANNATSGTLMLKTPGNNSFEPGQSRQFKLPIRDVFPLTMITIGHDNSGHGPAWHLHSVEVTNLRTGDKYIFPCGRWLSKSHGDMLIERDLHLLGSGLEETPEKQLEESKAEYQIVVMTSDIAMAGTDANVFILMFGTEDNAGPLQLESTKKSFERGARDVFTVKANNVGDLQKIRLWTDGAGAGAAWHCDMIIITNKVTNRTFYFYCGEWLSKEAGLEKTLLATLVDPRASLVTYKVTTHTSDISGAGTDANVFVLLRGVNGASGARPLEGKGNNMEQGKSDMFPLQLMDLGDLQSLDVWHDNSGLGPGWHLDFIEVQCSSSNKVFYFPCNQWFDTKEGDGLIRRTLYATLKDPRSFNARYRVSTHTSDLSGAGTDADVFINIYGSDGETGKVNLDNPGRNDFERGAVDVFEFDAKNVGPISKIRIGHDGTGFGAGWHLDKVEVENLNTGEHVTFDCKRWFDRKEDDGQIERDLFPTAGAEANGPQQHWKLTVITGDEMGAGTDANVFVSLVGSEGAFGPHTLTANKAAFERGFRDEFSLSTSPLGVILQMTLGHDGKGLGADWLLDSAILEDVGTGEKYFFTFNAWLNTANGLSRTAAPNRHTAATHHAGQLCTYRVEISPAAAETGNLLDGVVTMDIRGQEGTTGRQTIELPPAGFLCGELAVFELQALPDVGIIRQLEVGHSGSTPWELDRIVVINLTTNHRAVFLVGKVLLPGVDVLLDAEVAKPVDYKVEVKTGNMSQQGSKHDVTLTIFGSEGNTGEQPLVHDGVGRKGWCGDLCASTPFRRGNTDTFVLQQLPDVGTLTQIQIGHTGGFVSSKWNLEWVRVTNLATGEEALFEWGQYIEAGKKVYIDATLPASADVTPAAPPAGFPEGPPALLDPYGPPDPRLVAAFGGSVLSKFGSAVGAPGYKVIFFTGNAICAGTSAQVFFEVVGLNGSSGTILTQPGNGQFSRGAIDTFVFPRLPYLGDLLQLRVGTRGDGVFATWNVRTVEVVHMATGRRYVFDCHAWIDKKCNWQRVLKLARVED